MPFVLKSMCDESYGQGRGCWKWTSDINKARTFRRKVDAFNASNNTEEVEIVEVEIREKDKEVICDPCFGKGWQTNSDRGVEDDAKPEHQDTVKCDPCAGTGSDLLFWENSDA